MDRTIRKEEDKEGKSTRKLIARISNNSKIMKKAAKTRGVFRILSNIYLSYFIGFGLLRRSRIDYSFD